MQRGVVALMYRGVGAPADPAEGAQYTVTTGELEAQLEIVAAEGGALDPRRARTGVPGIVLTFDGGERSVLEEALPRIARRGWVAALLVSTSRLGRPGYLAPRDLRAFRRAGWVVGSHGPDDASLSALGPEELRLELTRSRANIARLAGAAPTHLSFAGGRTSPLVEAEARALGFTTLWSSVPGVNGALLDPAPLRRTAIRRGEPLARFRRLVRGDLATHAADRIDGAVRELVRWAVGEARSAAATGRALCRR